MYEEGLVAHGEARRWGGSAGSAQADRGRDDVDDAAEQRTVFIFGRMAGERIAVGTEGFVQPIPVVGT